MNDQQLIEALRAIGERPAVPDAEFGERLWSSRPSPRQVPGQTSRPALLLVAAALALLSLAVAVSVGAQLVDRRPLLTDVSTPAPTARIADATPSNAPEVPPSLPTFAVHIPDGLTPSSTICERSSAVSGA